MDAVKFAYIASEHQTQEIQWLRLSPGSSLEKGVYILLYRDISKPCLYDYWFENLDIAKKWAEKFYGVKENDWVDLADLIKRGIQVFDEL